MPCLRLLSVVRSEYPNKGTTMAAYSLVSNSPDCVGVKSQLPNHTQPLLPAWVYKEKNTPHLNHSKPQLQQRKKTSIQITVGERKKNSIKNDRANISSCDLPSCIGWNCDAHICSDFFC